MCVSGLFCTIGLVLYPVGWSSEKVKSIYCGEEASAFNIDQCSLGESRVFMLNGVLHICVV